MKKGLAKCMSIASWQSLFLLGTRYPSRAKAEWAPVCVAARLGQELRPGTMARTPPERAVARAGRSTCWAGPPGPSPTFWLAQEQGTKQD